MQQTLIRISEARFKMARNTLARALLRWLFWAAVVFLPLLLLHRLFSPAFDVLLAAAGLFAAALGIAAFDLARRFPSKLNAAAAADREFGLKEQLSSAFLVKDAEDAFARALVARAETSASRMKINRILRLKAPLEGKLLAAPLAAAVLLYALMPNLDLLGLFKSREERRQDQTLVAEAVADLEKKTRLVEEKGRSLETVEAKQVVSDMEQVAQMLERSQIDKSEALARISDLARKIEEQRRDLASEGTKDAFQPKTGASLESDSEKAIKKALQEGGKKAAAEEMMRQLKSLKDSFEGKGLDKEALEKAAREMMSLADKFKFPPGLQKKLQELSRALKEMAEKKDGDPEYKEEPPELDFTMEELAKLMEGLKAEDFLEYAGEAVNKSRQELLKKLKLCPYCQKGLKHPWEGGTALPGMGPKGEPGVGYI